jgi:hypothetical protein
MAARTLVNHLCATNANSGTYTDEHGRTVAFAICHHDSHRVDLADYSPSPDPHWVAYRESVAELFTDAYVVVTDSDPFVEFDPSGARQARREQHRRAGHDDPDDVHRTVPDHDAGHGDSGQDR